MTARVCYTADALYPEYKTARLETFGEDMTNQKRRIEDKLPTEPLKWDEDAKASSDKKILAIAESWASRTEGDTLTFKRGYFLDCVQTVLEQAQAGARQGGITSEESGAGDLTDERALFDAEIGKAYPIPDSPHTSVMQRANDARAAFTRGWGARAAIAAHLARQPKAEQPAGLEDLSTYPSPHGTLIRLADAKCRLAHLARQAQAQPDAVLGNLNSYWLTADSVADVFVKLSDVRSLLVSVAPASAQNALPTDLSHRLRETADQQPGWKSLLTAAADEIERYYGGMLAWKKTAEKKDRDWNAERMARMNERCAERASAQNAEAIRNQWISVDERLPECSKKTGSLGVEVIVYPQPEKGESTAFFGCRLTNEPDFYKYGSRVSGVTHWMHLPGAPSQSGTASTKEGGNHE